MYNRLLTSIWVAFELNRYVLVWKALWVLVPIGIQRSSHFLCLPYCLSVLLSIYSSLIHWFISQSVFFVHTVAYKPDGTKDLSNNTLCMGFSFIGIIFAFSLAITMLLALGIVEIVNKYPDIIPWMFKNSVAINATYHLPVNEIDAYLLPVQWEVISSQDYMIRESFYTMSKNVQTPVLDCLYSWWFLFWKWVFFFCYCLKIGNTNIYKIIYIFLLFILCSLHKGCQKMLKSVIFHWHSKYLRN